MEAKDAEHPFKNFSRRKIDEWLTRSIKPNGRQRQILIQMEKGRRILQASEGMNKAWGTGPTEIKSRGMASPGGSNCLEQRHLQLAGKEPAIHRNTELSWGKAKDRWKSIWSFSEGRTRAKLHKDKEREMAATLKEVRKF